MYIVFTIAFFVIEDVFVLLLSVPTDTLTLEQKQYAEKHFLCNISAWTTNPYFAIEAILKALP